MMHPPRPFIARKCGIKRGYDSYADAFRVASAHWRRYREKMVAYPCPLCGKYHIGHQKTEDDLSTAFVPLVPAKPKQEPKTKKPKQEPPVKKVKDVAAYYPPEDPFKKMEIQASRRAENECLRLAAIRRREEKRRQHEERMAARPVREGGFMWWVACDDGWNQHT